MERRVLVALILAIGLIAAACSGGVSVSDSTTDRVPPATAGENVAPGDNQPYTQFVDLAVEDVQAYWADVMPVAYGIEYQPVPAADQHPYDATTDLPSCGGVDLTYQEVEGNAFYCNVEDFVAWDEGTLFPELFRQYGDFTLGLVLAHEWGHVVQDQAGLLNEEPILLELQADCFAGAWTASIANGESETIELLAGDLDRALAGLISFRDEPGTSSLADAPHGTGFDRISAFESGLFGGASACTTFFTDPPTLVTLDFTTQEEVESGGNLSYPDTIEIAAADLNDYWSLLAPEIGVAGFTPISSVYGWQNEETSEDCGGAPPTEDEIEGGYFYCVDEHTAMWDDAFFRRVHEGIGDFAVASMLSDLWAVAVHDAGGITTESLESTLQRDCFAGSWAGNVYNFTVGGVDLSGREAWFTLSPGDLDEVILGFLAFSPDADVAGDDVSTPFQRVTAFRDGFFLGINTCLEAADALAPSG